MLPSTRLNELSRRKELLLIQSDLHRELLAVEHHRLQSRIHAATQSIRENRWWLLGGTLGAGWLASRVGVRFAPWLSVATMAWRWLKKSRA